MKLKNIFGFEIILLFFSIVMFITGYLRINPVKYLGNFKNINVRKSGTNKYWHVLTIKKKKKFNLGLKLITSFDIHKINPKWWGTKAIYVLK